MYKQVIKRFWKLITLNVVAGIVTALLSAFGIVYFQKILDLIAVHGAYSSLHAVLVALGVPVIIYALLMISQCVIAYLDTYPETKLDFGIYLHFKLAAIRKVSRIDFSSYQNYGTGQIMQLVENGAAAGKSILFDFYIHILKGLLPGALISLVFLGSYNLEIMWIIAAGYIVVFVLTNFLLKYLYRIKNRVLVNEEWLSRKYVRALMEMVVFRINKRYAREIRLMDEKAGEIVSAKTQIKMIHELFFAVFHLIVIVIKIAIIILGVIQYSDSKTTVGTIVAMVALVENVYQPIAIFNVLFVNYKLNKMAYNRFNNFLSQPDDLHLGNGKTIAVSSGCVEFHNVGFDYAGNVILENVSFAMAGSKSTAFAGLTGAGKSTILKLITGLIKPVSGKMTVDGVDISTVNLNSYYDKLAYISQDAPVFDGTIRENLVFEENISDEKIFEVLKYMRLDEMIAGLDKGLDTEIGERGVKLSGGEKQRVALARLFFQKSKIIILDEATSALDYLTEEAVINKLVEHLKDRTLIIVTHRLQTLSAVDEILVLENGALVQKGSYAQLSQQPGTFCDMLNKQLVEEKVNL
ncbi:MAG: ABC transporter ATP-binding protein [Negativicutes bacterium]|jgi:ATP-binding cassette subfamily B protein